LHFPRTDSVPEFSFSSSTQFFAFIGAFGTLKAPATGFSNSFDYKALLNFWTVASFLYNSEAEAPFSNSLKAYLNVNSTGSTKEAHSK
jgi:hypothetical protein